MNKIVKINDKMQKGEYELTQEPGENFDPEFKPELSPKELLEMGIFGGKYMTDCTDEFPSDWFEHAKLSPEKKDISLNYYQVDASLSLKAWQEKGWIHLGDPRGWFQWYCRYYYGRRLPEEDQIQIKRWKAIKRHAGAIKKNCEKKDQSCRKKQRQTLLHWAYDSRKI
ncbi:MULTISPECIES: hypothetical protein [Carnobacterium]|uniref:Uncharacterized protein n=1 Tax=Carnobacterium alterfunditum TaxID=28230 RepID=A0A1N6ESL3_9LACT|nr:MULTISPECIES: hypothetical protein [Carnobacterium]MBT2732246.1 hypothetical protein [Carnobacterium sp. ISL-102]SIN86059.1 hypothetical protein SAMN05878443_0178 [Carnobacterium alterfunditum]